MKKSKLKGKLIHLVIQSCRKATLMIEKRQQGRLGIVGKVILKMHLRMCINCSRYYYQSLFIERMLESPGMKDRMLNLSQAAKNHIQQVLEDHIKKR